MKRTFPHLSTILVACLFAPSALANDSPEGACESKHWGDPCQIAQCDVGSHTQPPALHGYCKDFGSSAMCVGNDVEDTPVDAYEVVSAANDATGQAEDSSVTDISPPKAFCPLTCTDAKPDPVAEAAWEKAEAAWKAQSTGVADTVGAEDARSLTDLGPGGPMDEGHSTSGCQSARPAAGGWPRTGVLAAAASLVLLRRRARRE